jgi:hypothetical protein
MFPLTNAERGNIADSGSNAAILQEHDARGDGLLCMWKS